MKKLFTIVLVSFLAINTSLAQVDGEGTVILGAYTELSNSPWSQVTLTPTIGYFLSDQIAVGLMFSLNTSKEDTEYDVWGSTTNETYTEIAGYKNGPLAIWTHKNDAQMDPPPETKRCLLVYLCTYVRYNIHNYIHTYHNFIPV